MDWKIELIPIPVSDVEQAKEFYVDKAGFNDDGLRPALGAALPDTHDLLAPLGEDRQPVLRCPDLPLHHNITMFHALR